MAASADFTAAVGKQNNSALLRRGRLLEAATLTWNVVGIGVLAIAAIEARSIALAGFGLDSFIEIGASAVVLWELNDADDERQQPALRLIAVTFIGLAIYLAAQSTWSLATGFQPRHSALGIAWTAATAAAMFALAVAKTRTGKSLDNRVLLTEGRVTAIDGLLAVSVLFGLVANVLLGWWWADPLSAYVLVYYAAREARTILTHAVDPTPSERA